MSTPTTLQSCYRLLRALQGRGIVVPEDALAPLDKRVFPDEDPLRASPLYRELLETFAGTASEYVQRLLERPAPPDWHTVAIGPDSPLEVNEWYVVANSCAEALASVLTEMQERRVDPTKVTTTDDAGIVIASRVGPVATIAPMAATPIDEVTNRRITTALKGQRDPMAGHADLALFNKVPGLQHVAIERMTPPRPGSEPRESLHPTATNLASNMREVLERQLGVSVQRSLAQELVAVYFGFESWNHFRGREKRYADNAREPYILQRDTTVGPPPANSVEFALGLPAALACLGARCRAEGLTHAGDDSMHRFGLWAARQGRRGPGRLRLARMEPCYAPDELALDAAKAILASSDLQDGVRTFLAAGQPLADRIQQFNVRRGIDREQEHILGEWVFYTIPRSSSGRTLLVAESLVPQSDGTTLALSCDQHKAAIIEHEGSYWLATDWNLAPEHALPGLSTSDVQRLEETLLQRKVRRRARALVEEG
jgi:hypothetical protein